MSDPITGPGTPSQPPPSASSATAQRAKPSIWEIYFPGSMKGYREVIHVASFPPILYFWPTIVTALLCAVLQRFSSGHEVTFGWAMIVVMMFNFLVLVQDFDQKQFVILMLSCLAIVLAGWVVTLLGFHFLSAIFGVLSHFSPVFSTDAYLVLGGALSLLFLWGVLSPLFSYWQFEQNEFVHYTRPIGRDMSIARAGCTVYKEIPDIFEYLLSGGGGTLIVKRDNQVVATIPNVPFLGRRMIAIEEMLSETRVVVDPSRT